MRARLDILLPLPFTNRGPAYTCGMIARGMTDSDLEVVVVTPRARTGLESSLRIVQALPYWARYVPYRWVRSLAKARIESVFSSQVNSESSRTRAAYIWPDASIDAIRALSRANITSFREMINCHRGTAKRILDEAYARMGAAPGHTISDESVVAEQESLGGVDYVFCPNPMVERSLLENGLNPSKLIAASYGWDPARFQGSSKALRPSEGLTAVFVGTICVRKGGHLLLEYWAKSKVRGRLVLAGAMEPLVKERCAALLSRDDVVVLDFVEDVGALYRSADIFVFPTLEEGGPQVTYEACGCALPALTTPMGSGRIVRHNLEGFVLDPYDEVGWVSAIQSMAEDEHLRAAMGAAASRRARLFRWNDVAKRRRDQVLQRLPGREEFCNSISRGYE